MRKITKNLSFILIANCTRVVAEKRAPRLKKTILTSVLSLGMVVGSAQSGLSMKQRNSNQRKQDISRTVYVHAIMPFLTTREIKGMMQVNREFYHILVPYAYQANLLNDRNISQVCKDDIMARYRDYQNFKSSISFLSRMLTAGPESQEYKHHESAFKDNRIQTLNMLDTKKDLLNKVLNTIQYLKTNYSSPTVTKISEKQEYLKDNFLEYFDKMTKIDKGFLIYIVLLQYCAFGEIDKVKVQSKTILDYNEYARQKINLVVKMLTACPEEYEHHKTFFDNTTIQTLDMHDNKADIFNKVLKVIKFLVNKYKSEVLLNELYQKKEKLREFFMNINFIFTMIEAFNRQDKLYFRLVSIKNIEQKKKNPSVGKS